MGFSIRIKKVLPLDDMVLSVEFENGISKLYDVKQLIPGFPIYERLRNRALFNLVHVDCSGCAVAWNEDIDISELELWEGGI
ncbi:MAG: DUF2442 domain-containing protein [Desulfamplus sp.]|nr:DUF2442 domain-containing protein [Desulfamplus sp.]